MGAESLYAAYTSVAVMGLLHGSDPSHGWPLSAIYTLKTGGGARRAVFLTLVLATGHFVSTIAIVAAAWVLGEALSSYIVYLQLGAGTALLVLGARRVREALAGEKHGHGRPEEASGSPAASAASLFKYALILGFAHEEEVALAAIVLLGVNPLILSLLYVASVYGSMVSWTLASVYAARRRGLSERFHSRLHAMTSIVILLVGAYVILEALGVV
jgi:ABC-type nickel/cobalt efflux system permease component RcnA